MIEFRLCFMHKIAYNSLNIDQIYPKVDSNFCLYTPNTYSEFQLDWRMYTRVIKIFLQSLQNDE